jgi:pimeloyl-ACP methyl ester carboxylesterase
MPGYGFPEQPKQAGWNADRIGLAWDVLMKRLGYIRYVAQGGDWGSVVADKMARQAPAGWPGIHVNMPAIVPPDALPGHHRTTEIEQCRNKSTMIGAAFFAPRP